MQKYDAIENGIANNDVKALREAIGSICYTNRDFSNGEFFEVIRYVEAKGIQLKDQELVGEPTISSQKSEFSDEDFAKAIFDLKRNFCDARIKDVETIGKKLYGKKADTVKTSSVEGNTNGTKQNQGVCPNQYSHQQNASKGLIAMGLVAGIAIIVIIVLLLVRK